MTMTAILQQASFALETATLYSSGDITEEQVKARMEEMRGRLDAANENWKNA